MSDDPLSGDRDQPPIVPMNNEEVVAFDAIRGIVRMTPGRRRAVLGGILGVSLIVLLVELSVSASSPAPKVTRQAAEHQALVSDCSRRLADEKAYANGTLTQEFFDRDLYGMMSTPANLAPVPQRLETDLESIVKTVNLFSSPAGPAQNDANRLCAS